jgi:hypothetical protein
VVEGVNAMLNGGFVNIQQRFFGVIGLTKLTLVLPEEADSAEAKKRHRRGRGKGTWTRASLGGAPTA